MTSSTKGASCCTFIIHTFIIHNFVLQIEKDSDPTTRKAAIYSKWYQL